MDFSTLTSTDVRSIVARHVFPWQEENRLFRTGDHFQKGAGWIGPGPRSGEEGYDLLLTRLEPDFISQNAIKAAVDMQVRAMLGKEPKWGAQPTEPMPEEDTAREAWTERHAPAIAAKDALLTTWWDKRKLLGTLQEFATIRETEGAAVLRLFVPPSLMGEDGQVEKADIETCLNYIYAEAVRPNQARIHKDREQMAEVGIYVFMDEEEFTENGVTQKRLTERAELTYLAPLWQKVPTGEVDENGVELTKDVPFLGADGKQRVDTIVRIVGAKNEKNPGDAFVYGESVMQLNGHLWHFQAEGEPLITAQVRSLQKFLNLALTVGRRTTADHGWLEEYLINTQLPGESVPLYAADGETPLRDLAGNQRYRFVPSAVTRGPGQSRRLVSETIPVPQEDGGQALTVLPADVKFRPPVDPETSITAANAAKQAIAEETHQEHLQAHGSDANSSGEYLKQKRANFVLNLSTSVAQLNEIGRAVLETAWLIAVAFTQTTDPFPGLKMMFECRVDAGPLSAAETQELSDLVEKGLLSRQTAMARCGVDDVDAEMNNIENDPDGMLVRDKQKAELYVLWKAAFPAMPRLAGQLAGLPDELVKLLPESEVVPSSSPENITL